MSEFKKANFNVAIEDIDGTFIEKPLVRRGEVQKDSEGQVIFNKMIMREVIANTLLGRYEGDEKESPVEMRKRIMAAEYVLSRSTTAKYKKEQLDLIEEFLVKGAFHYVVLMRFKEIVYGRNPDAEVEESTEESDDDKKAVA